MRIDCRPTHRTRAGSSEAHSAATIRRMQCFPRYVRTVQA
jgi:hypothetical protein